jgi:hypothetical protein
MPDMGGSFVYCWSHETLQLGLRVDDDIPAHVDCHSCSGASGVTIGDLGAVRCAGRLGSARPPGVRTV